MVSVKPFKLRPGTITAQHIQMQIISQDEKDARRAHDSKFATFWRRLGFAKAPPEFSWGIEDELAANLAREISNEIDAEIMKAIMWTK